MKITITPTSSVQKINDQITARVWQGQVHAHNGAKRIPVTCWIVLVGVDSAADQKQFEHELRKVSTDFEMVSFK